MSNPSDCAPCCTTPSTVNTPGLTGQSAFTTITTEFVTPALGGQITIDVGNTDWISEGQTIFIEGSGLYTVDAVVSGTSLTVTYVNTASNTDSGNAVTVGSLVTCACTGSDGADGQNAYTITTADFTVPAISGSVAISVGNSQWLTVGQNFFVQGAGYFEVASKADSTHVTGTYLDVSDNTNAGNNIVTGAGVSAAGPDLENPLTVSRGGTGSATATLARAALGAGGANTTVYGAGTAYSLTATPAALDFGTTDPAIVIPAVGVWLILARVRVDYTGATFAAVRTGTLKLRRTNNTAADLTSGSFGFKTDIITTLTYTLGEFSKAIIYTTTNTNDAITIFGDISVIPTAGSLDCVEADIIAIRLYDQTV